MAPQWGIHKHSTGHYMLQLEGPDSNSRVRSKSHEKVLFAGELRAPGPSPTSPLCQVCPMSPGTGLSPKEAVPRSMPPCTWRERKDACGISETTSPRPDSFTRSPNMYGATRQALLG